MGTTYNDYTAYFMALAEELLGHTDQEKHFFRKGLVEFLEGMQTDVNYPALLLERYDFKYNDNGSDSVLKNRSIAFIVADHATDREDYDRIDEIMGSMEVLVDRIVNRLRRDRKNPSTNFLNYVNLNSIQATPVEGDDNAFGFFVTADLASIHPTKVV